MRGRLRGRGGAWCGVLFTLLLQPCGTLAQDRPQAAAGYTSGAASIDPGWAVRKLGGGLVTLGEYRGRVLFINAWASWCIPCIREMASIERLAERLGDTDIAFLLIAVEGESTVRRHLRRFPLSLPVHLEHSRFPPPFGLRGIPMSWIVDREGRIIYRHHGAANWDTPEVEAFFRDLLAPGSM